jgi:hypothetical protein
MTYEDLEKLCPGLAEELAKTGGDGLSPGDIKIEASAAGTPAMLVRGIHVHSPRDPVREARRLAETAGAPGPVVILGFGLGYAAEAAAETMPGRPIIIVEKYPLILKTALETRNMEQFLLKNRVVFVAGKDGSGITSALSLFEKNDEKPAPVILKNRALVNLDEAWYSAVESRIKTWISRDDVNRATLKRFGKRWVRNLSRNMSAIRDLPGIGMLGGVLAGTGIPVFLAAAGPTLDQCAGLLPRIARRCVIVAVDTSIRFLTGRGIDPDFVVSVDPQYWNFRHLDRVPAPNTHLIAESAVYPPCLRHPFRGCFLCGSLFPLGSFIETRVDPKGELGAGGSVATTAWDFARVLGASSIWIAGLDLSFPGLKTHFRGALFEDRSCAESGRFFPVETWSVKALRNGQPFPARSGSGGTVLTDKRLSLYAAWFENRFAAYPEVRNFSFSGGGLVIKGLEPSVPETLFALPERREEIRSRLEGLFSSINSEFFTPEAIENRAKRYETACKTLLSGLNGIKSLSEDAAGIAETRLGRHKQGRLSPQEQEKTLKKLDAANRAITNSAVKEVAGFLFPELNEPVSGAPACGNAGDPLAKHLEFSAAFYRALAESAEYNLRVLSHTGDYPRTSALG